MCEARLESRWRLSGKPEKQSAVAFWAVCACKSFLKPFDKTLIQRIVYWGIIFEHSKQGFQPVQEDAGAPAVEMEAQEDAPQEPQKALFAQTRPAIRLFFPFWFCPNNPF
jgi:hypothetical protein